MIEPFCHPGGWDPSLAAAVAAAPLAVDGAAAQRLSRYVAELLRWSKRLNLTALAGVPLVERLIAPTLPFAAASVYRSAPAFADLGSGNGIPGVVLQVVAPRARCVLIEPRHRRACFLRHLVRTLPVDQTVVVEQRAEALGWSEAERVELVVSRAVAPPATLLGWCAPLLADGGAVALWGGGERVTGWQATVAGAATVYCRPPR